MTVDMFELESWLRRIGHDGPRAPSLAVLRAVVAAQSATIPFENIDVLLGRPPRLDVGSLQTKMVAGGRGGYCFEQNALLRAGLTALGFSVTGLIARVTRGRAPDASVPATHMVLRVDLTEGPFLADVGFGNGTPTAPLAMRPSIEQTTPHEVMRLIPAGEELTLQARMGDEWQSLYRLSPHPRVDADYDVANWFTATHPASPFVSNLIVSRPGADGVRNSFLNGRLTVRRPAEQPVRRMSETEDDLRAVLAGTFGLELPGGDLSAALAVLDRKGTRGATHPSFG